MNKVIITFEFFEGEKSRGLIDIDSSKGPSIEPSSGIVLYPADWELVNQIVSILKAKKDRFPSVKSEFSDL